MYDFFNVAKIIKNMIIFSKLEIFKVEQIANNYCSNYFQFYFVYLRKKRSKLPLEIEASYVSIQ